jgi:hypothetical protein
MWLSNVRILERIRNVLLLRALTTSSSTAYVCLELPILYIEMELYPLSLS